VVNPTVEIFFAFNIIFVDVFFFFFYMSTQDEGWKFELLTSAS